MDPQEIKYIIEKAIPNSTVFVRGDGVHFEATVISSAFEGKTLVEQHQMVYNSLGEAMREQIHALSLKTYTPKQWEKIKDKEFLQGV